MSLATRCADTPRDTPDCATAWGIALPPVCVYPYASGIASIERAMLDWGRSVGVQLTVTSRLRTACEQLHLYQQGATSERPTTSQHEFGRAFDIVPVSGYARYGVSRAGAFAWCRDLALAVGAGSAVVEGSHIHVAWFTAGSWRAFIVARDVLINVPYPNLPSKTPKPPALSPYVPPPPATLPQEPISLGGGLLPPSAVETAPEPPVITRPAFTLR